MALIEARQQGDAYGGSADTGSADTGTADTGTRNTGMTKIGTTNTAATRASGGGTGGGSSILSTLGSMAMKALPSIIESGASMLPQVLSSVLGNFLKH